MGDPCWLDWSCIDVRSAARRDPGNKQIWATTAFLGADGSVIFVQLFVNPVDASHCLIVVLDD